MSYISDQMPLSHATPMAWLDAVMADFDRFLMDHAACERKASALAMSLMMRYLEYQAIVEPMICLAKEELAHFHEVYRIMHRKGLILAPDEKDPYVTRLMSHVRHARDLHFMDRLLLASVIEARGCERFTLLGEHLPEGHELKPFYQRLAREEAGHYRVFLRLAQHYFPADVIKARWDELLAIEAQAMLEVPFRAAVH